MSIRRASKIVCGNEVPVINGCQESRILLSLDSRANLIFGFGISLTEQPLKSLRMQYRLVHVSLLVAILTE